MFTFFKLLFLFLVLYGIISFIRFIMTINRGIKNKREQNNNAHKNQQANNNKVIELNEDQYKVE